MLLKRFLGHSLQRWAEVTWSMSALSGVEHESVTLTLIKVTKVLLLPLVSKGGGVPRDPTVENHFPIGILQWNLHHIYMDYKKSQFCKKILKSFYCFKEAAK